MRPPRDQALPMTMLRWIVRIAALTIVTALVWGFAIEPATLRVKATTLHLLHWPKPQAGLRIALFADLHLGAPVHQRGQDPQRGGIDQRRASGRHRHRRRYLSPECGGRAVDHARGHGTSALASARPARGVRGDGQSRPRPRHRLPGARSCTPPASMSSTSAPCAFTPGVSSSGWSALAISPPACPMSP